MNKITTYIFILLWTILSLGSPDLFGQSFPNELEEAYHQEDIQPKSFDEEKWQKIIEDRDYGKLLQDKKKEQKKDNETKHSFDFDGVALWSFLVKSIFVLSVIGLGIFLALGFENGTFSSKKGKRVKRTHFDLEEIEEHLTTTNIDQLIQEAEQNGNYKIAIRLYYLNIIKSLSEKNIITYKKDKTNHAYFQKVDATVFGKGFRSATRFFERIWFGQSDFTKIDYRFIKPQFEEWLKDARQLSSKSLANEK